jgi:hypothetical protein
MERASLQVQTAYAELIEQLIAIEARRAIGHTGGTFVVKTVKGQDYYYHQHAEPGGIVQRYVGRRTPVLDRIIARFTQGRALAVVERARTERLCAQIRAGGALTTDNASVQVLAALADAAVFRLGGVLVGTHAFVVLGNLLGVRWEGAGLRTEDVDIATERVLAIAVPAIRADVPKVLESLEMGFLPVPGLSPREPSTSFKVRGRALRVDLLTPQVRGKSGPVTIARFAAAAEPLPYLEYVLEEPQPAAVVGGAGVLVNVPSAARFALHELLVARSRPATMQTKAGKYLDQAAQMITALAEDRPGDEAALEQRIEDIEERVVHDAVAKRRRPDLPALRIADPEPVERTPRVLPGLQLLADLPQPGFQMILELPHLGPVALAVARAAESAIQVVEGDDPWEQVLLTLHDRPEGRRARRPIAYWPDPPRWLFGASHDEATPGTSARGDLRWQRIRAHGGEARSGGLQAVTLQVTSVPWWRSGASGTGDWSGSSRPGVGAEFRGSMPRGCA